MQTTEVAIQAPRSHSAATPCARKAAVHEIPLLAVNGKPSDEFERLIPAVHNLKHQTALSVAYGAGLRVSEVVALKVGDIDSQRMTPLVERAKGRKDRCAMLSPVLPERLRTWWRVAHAQGGLLRLVVKTLLGWRLSISFRMDCSWVRPSSSDALEGSRRPRSLHSTVTLFARLRGLSTSVPRAHAVW